jgi:hypothetical protein
MVDGESRVTIPTRLKTADLSNVQINFLQTDAEAEASQIDEPHPTDYISNDLPARDDSGVSVTLFAGQEGREKVVRLYASDVTDPAFVQAMRTVRGREVIIDAESKLTAFMASSEQKMICWTVHQNKFHRLLFYHVCDRFNCTHVLFTGQDGKGAAGNKSDGTKDEGTLTTQARITVTKKKDSCVPEISLKMYMDAFPLYFAKKKVHPVTNINHHLVQPLTFGDVSIAAVDPVYNAEPLKIMKRERKNDVKPTATDPNDVIQEASTEANDKAYEAAKKRIFDNDNSSNGHTTGTGK